MNRLNINYSIEHKSCPVWLKFIDELFYEEDIPAVQEYLGYLLIPSTRGQKMMIIKGEGGEGKSRIGIVLKKIFGASLYTGSLQKVENSPFARACLEDMLVFLDDDLKLGALPDTNYIKSIVTAEEEMDVEKKALSTEGWYTVSGVKLQGAPTQKGVYIKDGKKVIIK